jgi:hypothetical protein
MRTLVTGLSSGTRQMMEAFQNTSLTLQQWLQMSSFAESRREILELSNTLRDRLGDYHLSPTETEHFASLARSFEPETLRSITQIAADCVVVSRSITHEIHSVSMEVEMLRSRGESHAYEIV